MNLLTTAWCSAFAISLPICLHAQACKPDIANEDKITKERVEIWFQEVSATSFGASLMSNSDFSVFVSVGRFGQRNAVNLELRKRDDSATNAAFSSRFLGAKGNQFVFGFKSGAAPVAFTVSDVSNDAKVSQGLSGAKGVQTVILSAALDDQEMTAMRKALSSEPIDAVRISLTGGQLVDKSVSDKNGKKMMEKFSCFYTALDEFSSNVVATEIPKSGNIAKNAWFFGELPDSVAPSFRRIDKPEEVMTFERTGTVSLDQGGHHYVGAFELVGDAVSIKFSKNPKESLRIDGRNLVGARGGLVWERISSPVRNSGTMTVDQVIQMVAAKISDDVIVAAIEKSASKFDLGADALIKLKNAGVSAVVMRAMLK